MEPIKLYYKSDFKVTIHSDAGWNLPFRITFWAEGSRRNTYVAQYDGETFTNCHLIDDNNLCIAFDDHGLSLGQLYEQTTYTFNDSCFPSGNDDESLPPTPVKALDPASGEERNVILDLQGASAVEIVYGLPMMAAELERQQNERDRQSAELQRIADEHARQKAERTRTATFEKIVFDITAWWTLLKSDFTSWWDGIKTTYSEWYISITADWGTWFAATKSAWSERFAKIGEDWDTWFSATKASFTSWWNNLKADFTTWWDDTKSDYDTWYTTLKSDFGSWWDGIKTTYSNWYTDTIMAWDTWFANTKSAWSERFAKIGEDWDTWFSATKDSFTSWWNNLKSAYSEWLTGIQSEWAAYIEARTAEWNTYLTVKTEAFTAWWDTLKSDVASATTAATEAAQIANTAANSATAAADKAATATLAANSAATAANEAAQTANTAATNADNATEGASKVNITSTGTEVTITDREGNQTTIQTKGDKGDSITMFPNVTIFGQPAIQESQISGFSASDYLQFPFIVDFAGRPWQIDCAITTGADVSQQHNVFDSAFGLAFAFASGKFILAMSSNGTTWNLGATSGTHTILANTTYYIRISWDGATYKLAYSTDKQAWTDDITVTSSESLAPKQIVIGKSLDNRYVFNGSINMSEAHLTISNKVVWEGMDDAGLATRMAIDMSNIDAAGRQRVNEIVIAGPVFEVMSAALASYDERILAIQQATVTANTTANTALSTSNTALADAQQVSNVVTTAVTNLDERMSAIEKR